MPRIDSSPVAWRPSPILGILSCLFGAGLAYLVINQVHPIIPMEDLPDMGPYPSAELVAQYTAAEYAFQSSNSAINCTILGALVGVLVGLLTASNRVLGGLTGALAGAVAGGLGGYLGGLFAASAIVSAREQSLLQSVGFLSIAWGLIGFAVCGAMAAIHSKSQIPSALIIGIVAGILGALAYNMIASILYPISNLVLITPVTAGERLTWALSFGTTLGVGIGFAFRNAKSSSVLRDEDDKSFADVA